MPLKWLVLIAQKMKFSIKDFSSKCDQIPNGKLDFFRSVLFFEITSKERKNKYFLYMSLLKHIRKGRNDLELALDL